MPVVLDKADIGPWLNGEAGIELLRPAEDRLRMWPVSRRVNKTGTGNDDPTLLDEVGVMLEQRDPIPARQLADAKQGTICGARGGQAKRLFSGRR